MENLSLKKLLNYAITVQCDWQKKDNISLVNIRISKKICRYVQNFKSKEELSKNLNIVWYSRYSCFYPSKASNL